MLTLTQFFVAALALACIALDLAAIWVVWRSPTMKWRPLGIIGSLFGFVGFSTMFGQDSDLHMSFGLQIPVVMWEAGAQGGWLKVMIPVVAIVALARARRSGERPK